MSKLEDIDPIFSKEGKAETPAYRLEDIDPIFKVEEPRAPIVKPASDKGFTDWLLNKVEPKTAESAAAALAGAYANPRIQNFATNAAQAVAHNMPSGPQTPVQKWSAAMGYGDRGQQTMAKAHEAEMGVRKGATIGGKTPTFNVQRPPIIETPPMGALQRAKNVMGTAGEMLGKIPRVGGALAGAGAAEGFQEASSRYGRGDYPGAAIAGIGGIGSLASMIPHPLARSIGASAGMASPAALMLLDKMREQSEKQPQRALQNVDAMGNPLP